MKKILVILITVIGLNFSANAIVWRGTHKVCGGGAELTLQSTGRMVFFDNSQRTVGTYSIDDGYLNLYDENGNNIYSFKYYFNNQTQQLQWVDMGGTKMNKCN